MSDPLAGLRAAIDAAKAIQADIDAMGMGKSAQPAPEPLLNDDRVEDLAADAMRGGRTTLGKLVAIREGMEQIRSIYEADRQQLHARIVELEADSAPLAMPAPDWASLPGATWWCVNADGRVAISEYTEPVLEEGWPTWIHAHVILDGGNLPVRVHLPLGIDWRQTLQRRPA
jgi:hypothetical protein